ncbi:putative glucose-6-phosphate 1-epimerase-like [Capsicum annuum]|uniref:ribosomal RNA processing protein 1 homolog n=1 Tax=Capsicum annuum TaxID=4072 RepID=UPI001FB1365F|nr:ribosomal RNA processing protein 1 homolog [Capsicum annuum]KAF3676807.1 putative glucose-6-phosphate 1-epimerase-like [Capsicum annuum]
MKKRLKESKTTTIINNPITQSCKGTSLIKHLASSKASIRSKAFKHIQEWLLTQKEIADDDMKKLWKGIFYCLWHSDKQQAQSLLITRICAIVNFLDLGVVFQYLTGFLITLRREWNGIDHLRLDKFYFLIRMFLRTVFLLLRKRYGWDLDVVGKVSGVLEDKGLFSGKDGLLGHGVSYHISSVFVDELKGCFVPVREDVVVCLFTPFLSVMRRSEDKVMVGKVKSCVFEELLKAGRGLLERRRKGGVEGEGDKSESYGDMALGIIALKTGFSGKLFEVGSAVDCVQGNRKVVLKLHEEFLRLEKEFEASGIEFSLPEINEVVEDDEEVPELIPIENNSLTGEAGDSEVAKDDDDEALRKCKKAKREEDGGGKKARKKEKKVSKIDTLVEENGTNELESSKRREKKKKKKKKKKNGLSDEENISTGEKEENMISTNGDGSNNELVIENKVIFNEHMISNLQMQFEKVAAEVASDDDEDDDSSYTPTIPMRKKRKRGNIVEGNESCIPVVSGEGDAGTKSAEKSSKKVSFAMKNNLVWKPNSPMPPQDLRLPPTLTPRGSALKKGVPPGPIREMLPSTKKMKQKKKVRKILRTVSPAMKRLKRVKVMSS